MIHGSYADSNTINKHLNMELLLKNGSLLIMDDDTQKYYLHEIAKELKHCDPRFSLTFRYFKIY